jgi:hypothetical protein
MPPIYDDNLITNEQVFFNSFILSSLVLRRCLPFYPWTSFFLFLPPIDNAHLIKNELVHSLFFDFKMTHAFLPMNESKKTHSCLSLMVTAFLRMNKSFLTCSFSLWFYPWTSLFCSCLPSTAPTLLRMKESFLTLSCSLLYVKME